MTNFHFDAIDGLMIAIGGFAALLATAALIIL